MTRRVLCPSFLRSHGSVTGRMLIEIMRWRRRLSRHLRHRNKWTMFRKPSSTTTPFTIRNTTLGMEGTDPELFGLTLLSSDKFLHATTRLRNMIQWHFPSDPHTVYCGISAYSFNTDGDGINTTASRVKVGMAFLTRNDSNYQPKMFIMHDGRVSIGLTDGMTITSTAALSVNGDVYASGSLLFNVATSQLVGAVSPSQIPLPASAVTSGVFHIDRIPTLAPSQFGSGVLTSTQMPDIPASQFASGVLDAARIPDFNVSHFSETSLAASRIPNLTANKFTTGPSFPSMFSLSTVMTPADIGGVSRWRVGTSSFATGVAADTIALNTWSDTSGGQANIVCLSKSSIAMRIYQGAQGSSATPAFRDVAFIDNPHGNLKVACTDNSVNSFQTEVVADSGWTQFRIRGSSLWGDGVATYNASNIYTRGVLYCTVENVMLYNPHIPSNNGGTAGIRFGRAGGVATGTWWEIGVPTDGTYHIAREAGANKITISTAGAMTLTGDVTAFSDARKKTDVRQIEGALDKVGRMRGVFYRRKDAEERKMGVVAQEIAEVLPEAVHVNDWNGEEMMAVAYGNVVGLLIEAVKEAREERNKLEALVERWRRTKD